MSNLITFIHFIISITTISQFFSLTATLKRGPHHPRSEQSKARKIDQHLTHEEHDIKDDLKDMGVQLNLDNLTEEEKHFYYFQIHDSDNNNALDGLEMLQAALHQEDLKKRDDLLYNATEELNHIIDVIDEFLLIADTNKDGFLHYPEYMKAVSENSNESKIIH